MWEAIIVAIITGVFTFSGVVYSSKKQYDSKYASSVQDIKSQILSLKSDISCIQKDIKSLEEKQDKHNSVIERMYAAEKSIVLIDERQNEIMKRMDKLEGDD